MTQVLIDRATLEQLVAALNEVDQHVDLKRYDTAPNEVLFDVVMEAITAGRAALANAEPTKILVLTQEYNAYDQFGAYFVKAWVGKPTADQLKDFASNIQEKWDDKYIAYLLSGGGREKHENSWYLLEEQL